MPEREVWSESHPLPGQNRQLEEELKETTHDHPNGQSVNRRVAPSGEQQCPENHEHVQEDRRGCRSGEVSSRIQDPHAECHEGDEEDVREDDSIQGYRQFELPGYIEETRCEEGDDPGRKGNAEEGDDREDDRQEGENDVNDAFRVYRISILQGIHVHGEKGGGQGPLGDHAAEHVRDSKGDKEGVRMGSRTEGEGDDHIPHQPKNPAEKGEESHRSRGTGNRAMFGHPASPPLGPLTILHAIS